MFSKSSAFLVLSVVPSGTKFGFEEELIEVTQELKPFVTIVARLLPPTEEGTLEAFTLYFQSLFGSFQPVAPTVETKTCGFSQIATVDEDIGLSLGSWTKTRTLRPGRPGTA